MEEIFKQEPEDLYCFINLDNDLAAWETAIGRMCSASMTHEVNAVSSWMFRRLRAYFKNANGIAINNEFHIEHIRKTKYPQNVSRLSGIYYFKTRNDAVRGLKEMNIKVSEENIVNVKFFKKNITTVDSGWITHNMCTDNDPHWIELYLSGEDYSLNPLHEVLADGVGIIYERNIRERAFNKLFEKYKNSMPFLSCAMCLFSRRVAWDVCLVRHCIMLNEQNMFKGTSIINLNAFEDDIYKDVVVDAVKNCIENNEMPPRGIEDFNEIRIPDFASEDFEFSIPTESLTHVQAHFCEVSPPSTPEA